MPGHHSDGFSAAPTRQGSKGVPAKLCNMGNDAEGIQSLTWHPPRPEGRGLPRTGSMAAGAGLSEDVSGKTPAPAIKWAVIFHPARWICI